MGLQRVGQDWLALKPLTLTSGILAIHSFIKICWHHCVPDTVLNTCKIWTKQCPSPQGAYNLKEKINNKQTNKGMLAGEQKNKAEKRDVRKQEQELFYMSSLSEKMTTKKRPEWSERVGQAATRKKNPVICAAGLWSNVTENFHSAPRKMSAELLFQEMLVHLKQPICFYLKDAVNQVNNCENI